MYHLNDFSSKLFLLTFLFFWTAGMSAQDPIYENIDIHHPVIGSKGMVSSQHHLATEAGIEILKKGGNAVDAAVAVGFALAVVLPRAGNLGGGGFMLVYLADNHTTRAINYREMAPAASTMNMFQDSTGSVDNLLFNQSYLSIGIPGTVAGLLHALENYGTMSVKDVISPAIKLAEEGFPVSYKLEEVLRVYDNRLKKSPAASRIFYKEDAYYKFKDVLVQKDLAWSLKQICKHGSRAFYSGEIGRRIVEDIQRNGGIMTIDDLHNYKVADTEPITGVYKDFKIVAMPPPSSGGVHIIQMLNILENFDLDTMYHNTAAALHLLAETMRMAYADRSKYLGDPTFWNVPVQGLISKQYAGDLSKKIDPFYANASVDIHPGQPAEYESHETTHFSVADRYGNIVSNSYTLNFSFGSGLMAPGTGILLNNEMGDFSAKPGVPDAYGLIGDEANAIQPYKRPLSSMSPTLVFKDNKPYLATGSPGGSRIISTVLQTIINVIDFDLNIAEASHAPKIHHQWYPDILYYENTLNKDTRDILSAMGHRLQIKEAMGSTQSIMFKNGLFLGASDPRRADAMTLGL